MLALTLWPGTVGVGVPVSIADEIEAAGRLEELQRTCVRLQRQLASAKNGREDMIDAVFRAARDAALVVGRSVPVPVPSKDKRRKGIEAGLLHLTDWQLGKETESYSSDICEERVGRAVAIASKLAAIQREDHPVPCCHVMLGGDLVENVATFPLQAFEVDSTIFEQVFRAAALVQRSVLTLLSEFETVEVWEVAGNHGRIGRKGDYPRNDNFDRIVGRIARENLAGEKRLTWHIPTSWYEIVSVGNYRALLVHGDQIKAFGGNVPHYGISKAANAWASGVVEPFDDLYLGHMHQVLQTTLAGGGRAFMTGSTESSSEYAREFMRAKGSPSQRMHFIDMKRGRVTAEYVLWLD